MDSKAIMQRIERVAAALEERKADKPTLVYADGSRRSVVFLEAVEELCRRGDVVDVLSQDETTTSLLRGMIDPWDFSDLPEVE